MSIYFNSSPVNFPFQFDSIGNNWDQEPTLRPDGFPLYHYLQTQEGCGILTIDGRDYTIEENQGVLLAPGVSHAYRSASGKWITLFATFSGSMSLIFPRYSAPPICCFLKLKKLPSSGN
ncbi:hypothetical protein DW961_15735 [Blautia sp. AM46-3MH]|nr:hypothetical protein DW961_15735 [Blautia sp. AM46-3MH]